MEEAAIGLLGVLVGALITAIFAFGMEVRREYRQGLVAARLVATELAGLTRTLSSGGVPPAAPIWAEQRTALAGVLDPHEWRAIAEAYVRVESLIAATQRGTSLTPDALEQPAGQATEAANLLWRIADQRLQRRLRGDRVLARLLEGRRESS